MYKPHTAKPLPAHEYNHLRASPCDCQGSQDKYCPMITFCQATEPGTVSLETDERDQDVVQYQMYLGENKHVHTCAGPCNYVLLKDLLSYVLMLCIFHDTAWP